MSELSGSELVMKWQDKNKVWHFEGSTRNLTKLLNAIGYSDRGYGSAVEEFLNDNPGAQAALVDWIAEYVDRVSDWREALEEDFCPECRGRVPAGETCIECGEEGEEFEE